MFHFIKKSGLTSYFINGLLYKVKPDIGDLYENRDKYYNTRYIFSDGKKYDLEKEKSIKSITAPKFDTFCNTQLGITGNLVYILRMKASHLRDEGKTDLALALLKRATEMMPVSGVNWSKKDYMRFANWLFELGEEREGEKAAQCIDELFTRIEFNNRKVIEEKINKACDDLGTDLVEASFSFGCCDECTKYRGRWYSRTGKDSRFPLKPRGIKCSCQGIDYYPVIFGVSEPTVNMYLEHPVDIIEYSNRPFIVERTEREI